MKVDIRKNNSFNGSYYGYHDEMEVSKASTAFKIMFVITLLVVPAGIITAIYQLVNWNTEGFVICILLTLAVQLPLIHLLMVLFDKSKYGTVRPQAKFVGAIFDGAGILVFVGIILSRFIHFIYILSFGVIALFLAIGIAICVSASAKQKRARANCTVPVLANCYGFDTLNANVSLLNNPNLPMSANNYVARTNVMKPIWEFQYNGMLYYATPTVYRGKVSLSVGSQYQIYINPMNPYEIYCEDDDNAAATKTMGIAWLIITGIMAVIVAVALILTRDYM